MELAYELMRGKRSRRPITISLNGRFVLACLGVILIAVSYKFWFYLHTILMPDQPGMATAMSILLAFAPPVLTSFLVPFSRAGMLLLKINMQTVGFVLVLGMTFFYIWHSYNLLYAWWSAQTLIAENGLALRYTIMSLLGFIGLPALVFTPVSATELVAAVEQAHRVKRFELETEGELMVLRSTLNRAYELATRGYANLVVEEREELAGIFDTVLGKWGNNLAMIGKSVEKTHGFTLPLSEYLPNGDEMRRTLGLAQLAISGKLSPGTAEKHLQRLGNQHYQTQRLDAEPRYTQPLTVDMIEARPRLSRGQRATNYLRELADLADQPYEYDDDVAMVHRQLPRRRR